MQVSVATAGTDRDEEPAPGALVQFGRDEEPVVASERVGDVRNRLPAADERLQVEDRFRGQARDGGGTDVLDRGPQPRREAIGDLVSQSLGLPRALPSQQRDRSRRPG